MNADIDIVKLSRLKGNWDKNGGKATTVAAINKANDLLNSISVSSMCDGGLAIDYEIPGMCLTVIIKPDGSIGEVRK